MFPQRYRLEAGSDGGLPPSWAVWSKSQRPDLQGAEGNIKHWELRQEWYRWRDRWRTDGLIPWTNVHLLWLGHLQEACLLTEPQLHLWSYSIGAPLYEHTARIRNVCNIIENVCDNWSDTIYNCSDKSPHLFLCGAPEKNRRHVTVELRLTHVWFESPSETQLPLLSFSEAFSYLPRRSLFLKADNLISKLLLPFSSWLNASERRWTGAALQTRVNEALQQTSDKQYWHFNSTDCFGFSPTLRQQQLR